MSYEQYLTDLSANIRVIFLFHFHFHFFPFSVLHSKTRFFCFFYKFPCVLHVTKLIVTYGNF